MTNVQQRPSGRAILAWCGIWALGLAGLAWLGRDIDWPRVRLALAAADPWWLAAAAGAHVAGLPAWLLAWRLLIPERKRPAPWTLVEAQLGFLAGIQSLSVLGAGLAMVFMLARRAGLGYGGAATILAFDHLLTGIAKLILIGVAQTIVPAPAGLKGAALFLLLATGTVLLVLGVLSRRPLTAATSSRFGRFAAIGAEFIHNLAALRRPGLFAGALALFLFRRSMEAVAALCVQRACGVTPSIETAMLIVAFLALATSLPGPPGNFGVYEAAIIFAYVARGTSEEAAVAMALLQHLAFLVPSVLPGYALILARPPWKSDWRVAK